MHHRRPGRPQPGAPESGCRQRGGGGGGFWITMRAWNRPFGSGAGVTGVSSRPQCAPPVARASVRRDLRAAPPPLPALDALMARYHDRPMDFADATLVHPAPT